MFKDEHNGLSIDSATDTDDIDSETETTFNLVDIRRRENNLMEFIDNISHELRTPITALRSTAEALLAGAKDDPALLNLFLINLIKESDRLSLLIDDLLEISKGISCSRKLRLTNVDVKSLVQRVKRINAGKAEDNKISITLNVPDNMHIHADEQQLEQVIDNLLRNAVQYTHSGGKVLVSAVENDDSVSISVSDAGIGISKDDIPQIFDRFYRVEEAQSEHTGCMGLGLSIVKDIVDAHGGTITVETEHGKGSAFIVLLPKNTPR